MLHERPASSGVPFIGTRNSLASIRQLGGWSWRQQVLNRPPEPGELWLSMPFSCAQEVQLEGDGTFRHREARSSCGRHGVVVAGGHRVVVAGGGPDCG